MKNKCYSVVFSLALILSIFSSSGYVYANNENTDNSENEAVEKLENYDENSNDQIVEEENLDEIVEEEVLDEVIEEEVLEDVVEDQAPVLNNDSSNENSEITSTGNHEGVIWELYSDKSVIIRPNDIDGLMITRITVPEVMNADKVIIEDGVKLPSDLPSNQEGIFEDYKASEIEFRNNTDNITSMSRMFYSMKNLVAIDFGSNFNTENVTTMYRMFNGVNQLESLDLSMFDTSNLINMTNMFRDMEALVTLDVGSADI